jgi:DMSO/TMAO reductase YedYZ molybdopterin-dependent catalytic subunit
LKKIFAGIAATVTIALVVISFAYNLTLPANSAKAETETEWQLTVTGLVENPLNLNWTEIVAMPKTTVNATLFCVDFPNAVVAQGNWTGIKLQTLLEEAKPSADAIKVGFHAADGYSTDLTVETAMRDDIILAYEKDDEPLSNLRLVVPGKWGYKWISQVTVIELVDYNFLGRWESQGYPDEADVSSGAQSVKDLKSLLPVPSPTPTPTTSPSPSPSQPPVASPAPLQQPTPTPKASKGLFLPIETVYAIASSLAIVIVVFGVIVVRKRAK